MPLITCVDCEKQISDQATSCPNCGCPTVKSLPVESLNITAEGSGAILINRGSSESADICLKALSRHRGRAGLTQGAAGQVVVLTGPVFGYNNASAYLTIVETTPGRQSRITVTGDAGNYRSGKIMPEAIQAVVNFKG